MCGRSSQIQGRRSDGYPELENLPYPLYEALKARAESRHRSIAQVVIQLLTEAVRQQKPLSILELQGLGRDLCVGSDAIRHGEAGVRRGIE